jgi:hypothetical protein
MNQPAIMHDAMRDAVNRINNWGIGAARPAVPHSANVPTQCPGDNLRALISQGRFNPGASGGSWFDMATEADLRRVVREVLNEEMGDVPFSRRFLRLTNRMAALLPAGNPDTSQGVDRNEMFRAWGESRSVARMTNNAPDWSNPSIVGNVLAFIDSRVLDIQQRLAAIESNLPRSRR